MIRRPDFMIVGAMKCATSTLHEQLKGQPGFFLSEPKEPCFFSDPEVWARGLDWYDGLFAAAGPGELAGESSTHYTKLPTYPETVARIAEHVPDARFVYVMRHPVRRLVSQYIHEWTERIIPGSLTIDRAIDERPELVDYSRYAFQLEPWFEHFGPERVLPVFFERLTRDPQPELERVCTFLGYEGAPKWQREQRAQNVSSERLRKSPWRDRLVNAPGLSFLRQKLVPQSLRDRLKSFWKMSGRPELSSAVETRLIELFDADLARLRDWVGFELDCASFDRLVDRDAAV